MRFCRITPAYAGNTSAIGDINCLSWDHPRIRGEHTGSESIDGAAQGSPPHTRGTHDEEWKVLEKIRITPAYAGNTYKYFVCIDSFEDHPRIRGEH